MVKLLLSEPELWVKVQTDPAKELLRLAKDVDVDMPAGSALETDILIYRMVVVAIGLVAILAVTGTIVIVVFNVSNAAPLLAALVSINSAAIGALAGRLSAVSFRR